MPSLLLVLVACTSSPPVALASAVAPMLPRSTFATGVDGVRAAGRRHAWFAMDGGVHLGDDLVVRTTAIGRGAAPLPVHLTAPAIADCAGEPCVQLKTPGVTEWWTDHGDGFEQGWTVQAAPDGVGELVVDLSVGAGEVALNGGAAQIHTATGGSWTVADLHAWDADGRVLSSRFERSGGGLRIAVDDSGARYPAWIDPAYSTPDYTLDGGSFYIVAGGGDVNADGYPDVAVSSHNSDYGWAGVFLGTPTGYDVALPNSTFMNLYDSERLDYVPVAFAGDVNGDGYEEVMVGDPVDERVNVYAGGAGGLGSFPEPTWTLPEFAGRNTRPAQNDTVVSVSGAGDVNGDGYADVIVGVPTIDAPGHATIYLGSSTGILIDETAVVLQESGGSGNYDSFGWAVAGAGDINADGYADVIVSGWPDTDVYYGSATGVATTGTALQTDGTVWAVGGAGDVNGDGYADVIVGVPAGRGKALVFQGGPAGITTTPAWQRDGMNDDLYGWSVAAAGDVNGDGYGDVITGSEQIPDIFRGSAAGLEADPVATLDGGGCSVSGAGDVDRDGLDDVVVGGGNVYLASTFMQNADTDADSDTDADTDTDSDADTDTDADTDADTSSNADTNPDSGDKPNGCNGAKGGCATTPSASFGVSLTLLAAGLTVARRRVGR